MDEVKETAPGFTRTQFYVGLAAAAALGAAIGFFAGKTLALAGDEPPIRVKGGSLEAEILDLASSEWKRGQGSDEEKKNWDLVSEGTNTKQEYFVKVLRFGGNCTSGLPPALAKRVQVDFPAQSFDIQHVGNKTKVKTKGGILQPTKKLIVFPGSPGHFVEKIWLHKTGGGAPWTCEFTSQEQFGGICLCASETECANICE